MDDNTAFVWLLGLLFASVALVRIVYWISWGVVNRAREHTKHLQIEAQERQGRTSVVGLPTDEPWPQYTVKHTTLPPESEEDR